MALFSITRNAFLESIRQPIHAVLIFVAILALVLNVNIAAYTLEDDDKLLVDLGLSTLFLTGLLLSAFNATSILSREIENKTVVTVVSKPVPRWAVVIGKFLGVVASIASAYWLLAIVFLLTVRHRVQVSVRAGDVYDGPVLTFGLLALLISLLVAGLANYLYRRPFPSTFSAVAAMAATAALGLVACIDRSWNLQSPLSDFDPQLTIGLVMVFEAVVVLAAFAVAASTRLAWMATLMVCVAVFLLGLVGEYALSASLAGSRWLPVLSALVPNFQFFWPADALTQGHDIPLGHLGLVTLYGGCLVGAVLGGAVVLFESRDVG